MHYLSIKSTYFTTPSAVTISADYKSLLCALPNFHFCKLHLATSVNYPCLYMIQYTELTTYKMRKYIAEKSCAVFKKWTNRSAEKLKVNIIY